jgi:hypothetical protein
MRHFNKRPLRTDRSRLGMDPSTTKWNAPTVISPPPVGDYDQTYSTASYGMGGMGHTAYNHVGDSALPAPSLLQYVAIGAAAYHGYKRNRSVGWAIGWGLVAGLAPIITIAVALAEGFGKPKGR